MKPGRRRRSLGLRLVMALLAAGIFLIGYQWGNRWRQEYDQEPVIAGVRPRPAVALPNWELSDQDGQPVGSAELAGFWVLLGSAPIDALSGHLTMARMLEVFNRLADQPALRGQLRLVLVSPRMNVDLARDFRRLLGQSWMLSGSPEQLARIEAILSGPTAKQTPAPSVPQALDSGEPLASRSSAAEADSFTEARPDGQAAAGAEVIADARGDRLADRSRDRDRDLPAAAQPVALYLIDPSARLIAIFPSTLEPAAIARDIRQLAKTAAPEP